LPASYPGTPLLEEAGADFFSSLLEYVRRHTVWLDLVILLRTVPAVLCRDGAA